MSVRWSVSRSVGWSVCHNFITGREVVLQCTYRSTCHFSVPSSFRPLSFSLVFGLFWTILMSFVLKYRISTSTNSSRFPPFPILPPPPYLPSTVPFISPDSLSHLPTSRSTSPCIYFPPTSSGSPLTTSLPTPASLPPSL